MELPKCRYFQHFRLINPVEVEIMANLTLLSSASRRRNTLGAGLRRTLAVLVAGLSLAASGAWAQEALNVQVGKAAKLALSEQPNVVVVGNPAIADVIVENSRLIFLMGLMPGETNLIVLDRRGNELISAPIVVTPSDARTVTVNRDVAEFTFSCNPRCAGIPTPTSAEEEAAVSGGAGGATGTGASDPNDPAAAMQNFSEAFSNIMNMTGPQ